MDVEKMLDIAVGFIAPVERFSPNAYYDVNGWAVGFGNHYYADGTAVKEGDTITRTKANDLIRVVARGKYNAIKKYITRDINEYQTAALVSLAYNCGEANVRDSRLLDLVNAGASEAEISDAYDETCVTSKGKYLTSLYKRRLNEIKLFFTPVTDYISSNPELSAGMAITVFGLLTWSIIRAAKIKK